MLRIRIKRYARILRICTGGTARRNVARLSWSLLRSVVFWPRLSCGWNIEDTRLRPLKDLLERIPQRTRLSKLGGAGEVVVRLARRGRFSFAHHGGVSDRGRVYCGDCVSSKSHILSTRVSGSDVAYILISSRFLLATVVIRVLWRRRHTLPPFRAALSKFRPTSYD
jgi:hypothetical protein